MSDASGSAVLNDGTRVAVWSDGSGVYSQRFDAAGNLVGDRLRLAAAGKFTGVAALASGGHVVEYQQPDVVLAQIVTPAGTLAGPPLTVRTQAQIAAEFTLDPNHQAVQPPSLAGGSGVVAMPDGGFAAQYLRYQLAFIPGFIPYELFAQKYDASGNPVGSPVMLRSEGSPSSFTTAPVPSGGMLVAEVLACPCSGSGAPGTHVYDQNLQARHIDFQAMPGANAFPSAAGLSGGNFVMAWTIDNQVRGQVFATDPTSISGSRNVTPTLTFQNAAPGARVTALAGGGFLLSWTSAAQAFDGNGQPTTDVMPILDGSVTATPDGGFIVVAQAGSQLVEQYYPLPAR
jgi:hypothetical protein